MLTTGEALLRAILDAPDDDGARLAYSDHLEEQGDGTRSTFIRVQCELASLNDTHYYCQPDVCVMTQGPCRIAALRRRERELLQTDFNEEAWFRDLPLIPKAEGQRTVYHWRRGFVEAVTCTAADWLAHADAVLAAQPVTSVTLTTWPEVVAWWDSSERFPFFYYFRGYPERPQRFAGPVAEAEAVPFILAAAWPRLRFTLPPPPPGG